MEYSELQKKGFEYAKQHAHLPLKERLDIIAQSFDMKSASVFIQPCTGKYRSQSDIMLRLESGGTIGIGMRSNAAARKDNTISECVNNVLAKYNPEIVAEAKERASVALKSREAEDNYNAEQRGLKPYKFLNVELSDGGIGNGHTGWYYATIAVENKVIGFITTDLASDIERGTLTDYVNRANYFVAGGLRDTDADFVFNNVGHSSHRDSYTIEMSTAARERAEKTLMATKTDILANSVYNKYSNIVVDRAGQYAVSSGTLYKDETAAHPACVQIVNRVVNDLLLEAGEHYPLFNQYMNNPDFKARLEDYTFIKAYIEPKEQAAALPDETAPDKHIFFQLDKSSPSSKSKSSILVELEENKKIAAQSNKSAVQKTVEREVE